jgi:hypothetical protein
MGSIHHLLDDEDDDREDELLDLRLLLLLEELCLTSVLLKHLGFMPCNQTVPGPVTVVTYSPSSPNTTLLKLVDLVTLYSTSLEKATRL